MTIGLLKMHERGSPSVSVPNACRQFGLKAGRKQVFSGSDGGLGKDIWTGPGLLCELVMPFTGFSTTSTLTPVDTLRAVEAAARLMCHATAPLFNRTPAFVHWLQELRAFPFLI